MKKPGDEQATSHTCHSPIALTLGPLLFNWPGTRWRDFYMRIADEAPIEIVYLGEVVCSKRQPFFMNELPDVVERLQRAGKTVIFSGLALPTLPNELKFCASLASCPQMVEVNDVSTLPHLKGRPHAIGPLINVYNEAAALVLIETGACRITLPPELPLASIASIVTAVNPRATIEVFAFGRVPLAISARCYHARLHHRTKDSCQFVCENDPDGLAVETLNNEEFLAINGVQTLSHSCCNLISDARDLAALGVSALRLSPQTCDMVAIAQLFRKVLDGKREPDQALQTMRDLCPEFAFSNGFLHGTNGAAYVPR
jgi:collagenase-like PrtC family protease